jgi:alpha-galactosidase
VPKIVFVGAGSIEFTKNLLGDILSFPELADSVISLFDIDPERLRLGERMAGWTNDRLGASATVEAHHDRRAALADADFVINMIQVGGHASTLHDFAIPARYGLRQTIGDTIGVGGVFRGLRTAPVMLDIAADMAEECPDAWFLNYTNPMAALCWTVYEGSPIRRIVGLCHSIQYTTMDLADLVRVPFEEIDFLGAGINHQSFILRFEHRGRDLYPRLDEAIERDPELRRRVRVEIYKRFGYFPSESSEHSAEYVPWFMRDDDAIARFRIPVDEYVRRSEEHLEEYAALSRGLDEQEDFTIERSVEYASLIIHSLTTGVERVVYGNVRNEGAIANLPSDACVEVPCLVDGTGLRPVHVGALPAQLAALNRSFLNPIEMTVRAALEEDRDHVLRAMMLDPNASATLTLDAMDALCDELVAAHAEYLPKGITRA